MATMYPGATFRAGHFGYTFFKRSTGKLVLPHTVTDPAPVGGVSTPVAIMPMPGIQRSEGFMAVESAGSYRDLGQVPSGRREFTINKRFQVADGSFLGLAIRDESTPSVAGVRWGLPLFTLEDGFDNRYEAETYAYQYVDCLMDTVRIDYAEGQPVNIDATVFALAEIPQPSPQQRALAAADILCWKDLQFIHDGVNYKPIISRASVTINNNVSREGFRDQLGALGSELAISRTALDMLPMTEKVQVSYGLRDKLPAALMGTSDWGEIIMRAEQPGVGAGRKWLQVVISHSFLNRWGRGQVPAGQAVTFTGDTASYAVTLTYGTT